MGVQRMCQGCFKDASRMLQGCFKEVEGVFQECFKGIKMEVSKVFQTSFKAFKGIFMDVSKVFQRLFREVLKDLDSINAWGAETIFSSPTERSACILLPMYQ